MKMIHFGDMIIGLSGRKCPHNLNLRKTRPERCVGAAKLPWIEKPWPKTPLSPCFMGSAGAKSIGHIT
jgi:hypothetical protein